MLRRRSILKYKLRKASGQGRARHNGQDTYFGPFDSDESKRKYARFIAELASRPNVQPAAVATDEITISELILFYLRFAKGYYRERSGAWRLRYASLTNSSATRRSLRLVLYASKPSFRK